MEVYDKNLRYCPTMGDSLGAISWYKCVRTLMKSCCDTGPSPCLLWLWQLRPLLLRSCKAWKLMQVSPWLLLFFLSVLVSTNNGTKDFLWSRRLGVNLSQISSKWINKVTVSSTGLPLTNKEPQPALGELGICLCLRWYRQGLMRKMFASHFQRNLIVKARESLLPLMPPVFFLEDQEGLIGYECCFVSHGCPRTPGTWLSGKLY